MTFSFCEANGLQYCAHAEWLAEGIDHGFTGADLDFSRQGIGAVMPQFVSALGLKGLVCLHQVHGSEILDLRARSLSQLADSFGAGSSMQALWQADALLFKLPERASRVGVAIGIRTADCLPIIIRLDRQVALVHAGWRGLASGLIEKLLRDVLATSGTATLHLLIGPHASASAYQVGPEVIEAIGSTAVFEPLDSGKARLDLAATAVKQAAQLLAPNRLKADICPFCTIGDRRFHSYRRDGTGCGSNLAFVRI